MATTTSSSRQPAAPPVLLLVLALAALSTAPALASKECEQLGMPAPACSDCESMSEYLKDEELLSECQRCCVKAADDNEKYTSATLQICPFRLNGLPAIKDFIDKHAKIYGKALVVSEVMGAYPKLVLKNKVTGASKSVRIDQWKVATIHEFLKGKLDLSGNKASSSGSKKKKAAAATATS